MKEKQAELVESVGRRKNVFENISYRRYPGQKIEKALERVSESVSMDLDPTRHCSELDIMSSSRSLPPSEV